ncbi:glycosyltransferase family 2 protein [Cohnella cholangitidis]|uniref:Glycosyltransferase family 2 protein n=1 Tax=Cohnella cholangitidis TaxID=2598458 RepID=A0A7G5BS77_9BACL|nr:glycosyltransferase family 2 protein [Cohnella cholangitidis]QMV39811.1 glycosyltransferase family 2 protein [Cohnella cholangitidis]
MKTRNNNPVTDMDSFRTMKKELKWTIIDKFFRPVQDKNKDPFFRKMKDLKRLLIRKYRSKSQRSLISVIMPTFNRAKVIPFAIRSVLRQSYRNWELIIVDDGGQDDTERVVQAFKDPRIRYFKKRFNKGAGSARNAGLRISSGTYLAYLDSDNEWDPDYLLLMVNALKNSPSHESIYCGQDIYRSSKRSPDMKFEGVRAGLFNRSMLENKNYIDLNVFMHHRSLYEKHGGFDAKLVKLLDWDLLLRYSNDSFPFFLPCRLGTYYFGRADNQITFKKRVKPMARLHAKLMSAPLILESAPKLQSVLKISSFFSIPKANDRLDLSRKTTVIFVPNSKDLRLVRLSVEALLKNTDRRAYSLIVIEHHSSRDFARYLKSLESAGHATIIWTTSNSSLSRKVNLAISAAESDHDIAIVNHATLATNGWLGGMQQVITDIPNAGIVVPRRVLPRNSSYITQHVPFCSRNFEADVSLSMHNRNIVDPFLMLSKGYVELSYAPLMGVLLSREWLKRNRSNLVFGKNDYKSNLKMCEQAVKDGFKVVYTPHSKIYYVHK